MHRLLLILLVPLVIGCGPRIPAMPGSTAVKPSAAAAGKKKTVDQLEQELAEARQKEADAKAERRAIEWQLDQAKLDQQRSRLHWVMGICLLGVLGCVAGAIWLRGLAKYFIWGAAALLATAAAAWGLAWLLPYIAWVVAALVVLCVGAAFVIWRNDHKGLRQVAQAVESFKDKMPGYKEHFNQIIDTDVDSWLTRVRRSLGVKT